MGERARRIAANGAPDFGCLPNVWHFLALKFPGYSPLISAIPGQEGDHGTSTSWFEEEWINKGTLMASQEKNRTAYAAKLPPGRALLTEQR